MIKKENLLIFGLSIFLISVLLHKKSDFGLLDVLNNIVAFSMSLLALVYCIWYKKMYNETPKLVILCFLHLLTSFFVVKMLFLLVLFEYTFIFLYYSRKKIVNPIEVDLEIESYLAVINKNKTFFTRPPLYLAIIVYACVALFLASRTFPL